MTKSFLPATLGIFLVPMTLTACVTEEVTFYGNEHAATASGGGTCEAANSCLAPEYRAEDATWDGAACIAMADNALRTDGHAQLRVSQLAVESPAVLTQPFMQTTIITEGITPTRPDASCRQQGTNRFNILLDFNFETMEIKVGSAIPQSLLGHTVGEGTCWANYEGTDTADLKSKITPVSTTFTVNESTGEFEAVFEKGEDRIMNVPIYVADTEDDFALLPLRELVVTGTLTAGNSCVGKFVHEDLTAPTCAAGTSGFRWENAGKYVGYVTVEDADTVDVSSLGFSLCTLLSGNSVKWDNNADGIGRCVNSAGYKANSNKLPEGNWCSVSNSADASKCGGVLDSWQLKTEFAASGIKIDGDCPQGG